MVFRHAWEARWAPFSETRGSSSFLRLSNMSKRAAATTDLRSPEEVKREKQEIPVIQSSTWVSAVQDALSEEKKAAIQRKETSLPFTFPAYCLWVTQSRAVFQASARTLRAVALFPTEQLASEWARHLLLHYEYGVYVTVITGLEDTIFLGEVLDTQRNPWHVLALSPSLPSKGNLPEGWTFYRYTLKYPFSYYMYHCPRECWLSMEDLDVRFERKQDLSLGGEPPELYTFQPGPFVHEPEVDLMAAEMASFCLLDAFLAADIQVRERIRIRSGQQVSLKDKRTYVLWGRKIPIAEEAGPLALYRPLASVQGKQTAWQLFLLLVQHRNLLLDAQKASGPAPALAYDYMSVELGINPEDDLPVAIVAKKLPMEVIHKHIKGMYAADRKDFTLRRYFDLCYYPSDVWMDWEAENTQLWPAFPMLNAERARIRNYLGHVSLVSKRNAPSV